MKKPKVYIEEIELRNLPNEGDPLVWLRQHRREISDRFETAGELSAYLKQFGSVENALARVREKIAEKKRKEQTE